MSIQEKFTAAVNVIRSLPKNGAYQPSNDLLLRFYAYYKQATNGPNNQSKPSFWDVVNRTKWQAWKSLGNMSKETAMQEYVNELKKIVETMAYTNPVADFVSSLDSFYESVSMEDLEKAIGPIERGNLIDKANSSSTISIPEHLSTADTEGEEECFHDVIEVQSSTAQQNNSYLRPIGYIENEVFNNHIPEYGPNAPREVQLNEYLDAFQLQIRNSITAIRCDLDVITNKVAQIEQKLKETQSRESPKPRRILRHNLYQRIFLIGWPIIVHLIFIWFKRRNRQKALSV